MIVRISLAATVIGIVVIGLTSLAPAGATRKIQIHTKDMPEHGVKLVSPADPSYSGELEREKSGKDADAKQELDSIAPFSAFLRNESGRLIVAYTLKWEITRNDGKTVKHFVSISDGDALSGGRSTVEPGPAVQNGSSRFVALAPLTSSRGITITPTFSTSEAAALYREANTSGLLQNLVNELVQASDLTLSLDNVVFENGEAVGADSAHTFDQLRSALFARNDLLRAILNAIRRGKSLEDVMSRIKNLSESEVDLSGGRPADVYKFHRREFAAEIVRIRAAVGDDKTALWYALQPLAKKWPELRKKVSGDRDQE